jgi:predicted S18 family serine protease
MALAGASHLLAAPGDQLWVSRYGADINQAPVWVAVSPGGGQVFVAGGSSTRYSQDYATVAYSAATGE